jgi:hypothetical protein
VEALIFVEVLDRRGHVVARTRVSQLPFAIGRSYASDLILDDPQVSPSHARLERDERGALVLRDLGSTNGIARGRERLASYEVRGDDVFHLGRTLLRVRSSADPVPEAIPAESALLERIEARPGLTLLLLPLVVGIAIAARYRSTYQPVEWLELWRAALTIALVLGSWAGVWAFVSRLLSQRAHLAAHWTIACAAALVGELISAGSEWAQFLVPSLLGVRLGEFALQLILASLALHAHLSAAGAFADASRRGLAAIAVSVAVLGLFQSDDLVDGSDFVTVLPYWSRLEPLDPSWLGPESTEVFFSAADALRADVDELATRPAQE